MNNAGNMCDVGVDGMFPALFHSSGQTTRMPFLKQRILPELRRKRHPVNGRPKYLIMVFAYMHNKSLLFLYNIFSLQFR